MTPRGSGATTIDPPIDTTAIAPPASFEAMTAADILDAAYTLIDRYGHQPDTSYGTHNVGFSLDGALYEACRLRESEHSLYGDVPATDPRWRQVQLALMAVALVAHGTTTNRSAARQVADISDAVDADGALTLLSAALRHTTRRAAA